MVSVMTKQTMRAVISMEVTVVDQMLTPNTVQNVFVINKHRMIIQVTVCLRIWQQLSKSCSLFDDQ